MRNEMWFKNAVFYQIYPRSFCDSNNDGIGDLNGITSKLDYLKDLGVNCVWLSPCYKSPNDDIGYDISDYYEINPEYGTMADFERMLEGLHARGIKLIMDLVVNHTSDEHPWFVDSKSSENSPYRDYYYWRKGKNGKAPNNWNSSFTGPAWEYDKTTDSYYLHLFTKKQVDLNWENPLVREEVVKILNFWFDKGVDGFRCDVINYISKVDGLPDDKALFSPLKGGKYYTNGPRIHQYLNFLNENAFSPREKLFLGECPGMDTETAKMFTKRERHEMDIAFTFEHVETASIAKYIPRKFKLKEFKGVFSKWQRELMTDGWNSLYLENHDQARSISRFCSDTKYRAESAKMLATMLATLKGTMFIFEGQELGMKNHKFEKIADFPDTATQSVFDLARHKLHLSEKFLLKCFNRTARDHARLPMPWKNAKNGGFSDCAPWMPTNDDVSSINVESEQKDETSVLNFYKSLLKFRKQHPEIISGNFTEYLSSSNKFFAYSREDGDEKLLVVMNFSENENSMPEIKDLDQSNLKYVFGNYEKHDLKTIFKPYEVRVYEF